MTTNAATTYLQYANLQMAAEAIYPINFTAGAIPVSTLTTGNTRSSKFTETQAKQFVSEWEVLAHQPNQATGFSGTLFQRIKDDPVTGAKAGELVLSFRSTEFIDDAARDNQATNTLEISKTGWAFGQIDDMKTWVDSLATRIGTSPLTVTGYSLGGHLATAFNLLYPGRAAATYTFNGAGVGKLTDGSSLTAVINEFRDQSTSVNGLASVFKDPLVAAVYTQIRGHLMGGASVTLQDYLQVLALKTAYSLNPLFPLNSDAQLLFQAISNIKSIDDENTRVANMTSGTSSAKPNDVLLTDIEATKLDYQLAMLLASRKTAAYSAVNVFDPTSGANNVLFDERNTVQPPFANFFDIYGATSPSVVASSQLHYGVATPVFIEDQPLYRGSVLRDVPWASITNLSPKLLVDKYAVNDFGDTHSLVLLIDSLNIQSTLAALDPTASTSSLSVILKAASHAKKSEATDTQGKAEGDVLENTLDALRAIFLGKTSKADETPANMEGNTWAEVNLNQPMGRDAFYKRLEELTNSSTFKSLKGKLKVTPSAGDASLGNAARKDFGALLTLLTLSPVAIQAAKPGDADSVAGQLAGSKWSTEFQHWKTDKSLVDKKEEPKYYSDTYLQSRNAMLQWMMVRNLKDIAPDTPDGTNVTMLSRDVGTAVMPAYYEDMTSRTMLALGKSGIGMDPAKTIFGSKEAESIKGGADKDRLFGGDGADTIKGNAERDYLEGNEGGDLLNGGNDSDILLGGEGSDTYEFAGTYGADVIYDSDGQGKITVNGQDIPSSFSKVEDNVYRDKATGWYATKVNTIQDRSTLVLYNSKDSGGGSITIQRWRGGDLGINLSDAQEDKPSPNKYVGDFKKATEGSGDDEYYKLGEDGNYVQNGVEPGAKDVITGSGSDDSIQGQGGNDALSAGAGDDTIEGGDGADLVFGGKGLDHLHGGAGNDWLFAGDSGALTYIRDTDSKGPPVKPQEYARGLSSLVREGEEKHTYTIDWASQILEEQDAGNLVWGDAGDDRVQGGWASDTLYGGTGKDGILGSGGDDVAFGEDDNDYLYGDAWSTIYTGTTNSLPAMRHGRDTLDGGKGDDFIFGDGSDDKLFGGQGDDELDGDEDHPFTVTDAENISMTLPESHGFDYLDGGEGDDTLSGGGRDDSLWGGIGEDKLYGDYKDAKNIPAKFHGDDFLDGGSDDDLLMGNGGNDYLIGGFGNDQLLGDDREQTTADYLGRDSLSGGDGNDTLMGGGGSDVLWGDDGDDALYGDDESNYVNADKQGGDTLYGGTGNDSLNGQGGDDVLSGGAGNDYLYGGDGDDTLSGGSGLAYMDGEKGNDTYLINVADLLLIDDFMSTISDAKGKNAIVIQGGALPTQVKQRGHDLILTFDATHKIALAHALESTFQTIAVEGQSPVHFRTWLQQFLTTPVQIQTTATDQELIGGSGNDSISSTMNGTLDGGQGNDQLIGLTGNETYVFRTGAGRDSIADIGGFDTARFEGIGSAEVTSVERVGTTLSIKYGYQDQLDVDDYFAQGTSAVERFAFADGVTWDAAAIQQRVMTVGTSGNDALTTPDGLAARLNGLSGNDTLTGGTGADTLIGDEGNDSLKGGTGSDTYLVSVGTQVDHIAEQATMPGDTDVVIFDAIRSTDITRAARTGNDLVMYYGTASQLIIDQFYAATANEIEQFQFADGVTWTAAAVKAFAVTGNALKANAGFILAGTTSGDKMYGLDGKDTLQSSDGDDFLFGSGGDDSLDGGQGNDWLHGGTGNDTLIGGSGTNALMGGAGNDLYIVSTTTDTIAEQVGDSLLGNIDAIQSSVDFTLPDNVETLTLTGTANTKAFGNAQGGNLFGNTGNNRLVGGSGNDALDGGTGADTMEGGLGDDTYVIRDTADVVIEVEQGGSDAIQSYINALTIADGVEYLYMKGAAAAAATGNGSANTIVGTIYNDTLWGLDGDDTLQGGSGIDSLHGGAGNDSLLGGSGDDALLGQDGDDTLDGGGGADSMTGGLGDDSYMVNIGTDKVLEVAGSVGGNDVIFTSVDYILPSDVESLTQLGLSNLTGTGSAQANLLLGNAGNNKLIGGLGNDTLDGGAGIDTLDGGSDNDVYLLRDSQDTIIESQTGGTADEAWSYFKEAILPDFVETLVLKGPDARRGQGTASNDRLVGNLAGNTLRGLAGKDTLDGGVGRDTLIGGDGDDTYVVDNAKDVVRELATSEGGVDTIESSVSYALPDNVENLTLTENATGYGNDADNYIRGSAGADSLYGGTGVDTLDGGRGNDFLVGGGGDIETYIFGRGYGVDTIDYYSTNDLPSPGNFDTVQFGPGITENDLEITTVSSYEVRITIKGTTDQLRITRAGSEGYHSESLWPLQIKFSDASEWSPQQLTSKIFLAAPQTNDSWAGTYLDEKIDGGEGADTLYGSSGNDTVDGGSGADIVEGGEGSDDLRGGSGNDIVIAYSNPQLTNYGLADHDTLSGDAGNDLLIGGAGIDTYRFGRGFGRDTIQSGPATQDTLELGSGILNSDLTLSRKLDDLLIQIKNTADSLLIQNYFYLDGTSNQTLGNIKFSNGDNWKYAVAKQNTPAITPPADLSFIGTSAAEVKTGGNGNDTLSGAAGDDTLDGGLGNDLLDGGAGNDVYKFGRNSGNDTISGNDSLAGKLDSILLESGISEGDISVVRLKDDLLLSIKNSLSTLQIRDFFTQDAAGGNQVDAIQFPGNPTWNLEKIKSTSLLATVENDTLIGYSSNDNLSGLANNDSLEGRGGNDSLYGGTGDDTLAGGEGDDLIDGGFGNDLLKGGTGLDTYAFGRGYGRDTINLQSYDQAYVIKLGENLTEGDIQLDRIDGATLRLRIKESDDELMVVSGYSTSAIIKFNSGVTIGLPPIPAPQTSNGGLKLAPGIEAEDINFNATDGYHNQWELTIKNTNTEFPVNYRYDYTVEFDDGNVWYWQDLMDFSLLGDDTNQYMIAGADENIDVAANDGDDTIVGNGNDLMDGQFGDDSIRATGGGNILAGGDGDDYIYSTSEDSLNDDSLVGGNGADTLTSGVGAAVLTGGRGDDLLIGGGGSDLYIFSKGDGNDTISPREPNRGHGAQAVISFADVVPTDIVDMRRAGNNLVIQYGPTDKIAIEGFYTNIGIYPISSGAEFQAIEFSNGETWSFADVFEKVGFLGAQTIGGTEQNDSINWAYTHNLAELFIISTLGGNDRIDGGLYNDSIDGGSGDDTIYAANGRDRLIGGSGNDELSGGYDNDTLTGGPGDDTLMGSYHSDIYVVGKNSGRDVIQDSGGADFDTLNFSDVSSFEIANQNRVGDDLVIQWGTNQVTIKNQFFENLLSSYSRPDRIEQVTFADGVVWDLITKATFEIPGQQTGSPTAETLTGTTGADLLNGAGGNDTLIGNGGNDSLAGGADNDSLAGGNDNDQLEGGKGNDTIDGGTGDNLYLFALNDGQDQFTTAASTSGTRSTVQFAAGIAEADVQVSRSGADLILSIPKSGDRLVIRNFATNDDPMNSHNPVQLIRFADGNITWNLTDIIDRSLRGDDTAQGLVGYSTDDIIQAMGGNDTLLGQAGDDFIIAGDGNDSLDGGTGNDWLQGDDGNDTYSWGKGSGQDTLYNQDANPGRLDVLQIKSGVTDATITVSRLDNDVQLGIAITLDTLLLKDVLENDGLNDHVLDQIRFTDQPGITWTINTLKDQLLKGSASDDLILGYASNDTINAAGGNDTVYGLDGNDILDGGTGDDSLIGGNGNDRYKFARGMGSDVVIELPESGAGTDTIEFAAGIQSSEVKVTHDASSVTLKLSTGEQLKFGWSATSGYAVENFVFNNGALVWGTSNIDLLQQNTVPTGTLTITGTASQGQTLTVVNTVADADGMGPISYQWLRDGEDTGVRTTSYGLAQADVGKKISVRASYTDFWGTAETVTSPQTSAVSNVNDAPTGTVTVTGTARQGQTLTASNNLADADGIGIIAYQWFRDDVNTTSVGTSYLLSQADVGKAISAKAIYKDQQGTNEAVTSTKTLAVLNVNDAPTGTVTISGNALLGSTLTASNTLADADGMGSINYQWLSNGLAVGVGANHLLTHDEVGTSMSVIAAYTDKLGFAESVRSGSTAAVAIPAGVQSAVTYVMNSTDIALTLTGTANINGTGNSLSNVLRGNTAVNLLKGGSGDDLVYADQGNDTLYGESGSDTLYGGDGNDLLDGGASNDLLVGGKGDNLYAISKNDGIDVIDSYQDATTNKLNTIKFRTGIAISDVSFKRASGTNDLELINGTDKLTARDFFNTDTSYNPVQQIAFADGGFTLEAAVIRALSNAAQQSGTTAADTLSGTTGSDLLYGLASNDALTGLAGSDFLFGGDGNDNLNGGSDADMLFAGLNDDVVIGEWGNDSLYGDDGNDLIDGGKDNDLLNGGKGNNTFAFSKGDGVDVIDSLQDATVDKLSTIKFRAGVLSSDVSFKQVANNLELSNGTDKITVREFFNTDASYNPIQQITFTDGAATLNTNVIRALTSAAVQSDTAATSSLTGTANSDRLNGLLGNDTLLGLAGADILFGGDGNDSLDGGADNDWLLGEAGEDTLTGGLGNDTLIGGNGNDRYMLTRGMGSDLITETIGSAAGTDTIEFASDIQINEIQVLREASTITVKLASGEQIKFDGSAATGYSIEKFVLNGGQTNWGITELLQRQNNAPTGAVTISGTATQGQTLTASNTLADADGLGAIAYQWWRDDLNTGSTGPTYVLNQADVGKRIVAKAVYTDGRNIREIIGSTPTTPVLNFNDAPTGTVTLTGTAALGQTLTAANTLADVDGMGTITYQWLSDGVTTGNVGDTYTLGQSDIGKKISVRAIYFDGFNSQEAVTSAQTAAIAPPAGLQSDVTYIMSTTDTDLTLTGTADINGTGNGSKNVIRGNVGKNTLNGGSGNDSLFGAQGNDTLQGDYGDDTLFGDEGFDFLDGGVGNDLLNGGLGNNTYAFGKTDGTDVIESYSDATVGKLNTLKLRTGITASDVTYKQVTATNDLEVGIAGTGKVTVRNFFNTDASLNPIQQVMFSDGNVVLNTTAIRALIGATYQAGTTVNDTFTGTAGADLLNGQFGNDVLTGLAGTDFLFGGDGNDNLNGGSEADLLYGGIGDDTVTGDLGDDTLYGDDGNDHINAGKGNDLINGGKGSNTYVFAKGDGVDVIDYTSDATVTKFSTVQLGAGFTIADMSFKKVSTTNNGLEMTHGTDKITINEFYNAESFNPVQQITFADGGIVMNAADVRNLGLAIVVPGTATADTLNGSAWGDRINGLDSNDKLNGLAGADFLFGGNGDDSLDGGDGNDWLFGGVGNDTLVDAATTSNDVYSWGRGMGADALTDAGGTDRLDVLSGATADQIWLRQVGNNLELSVIGSGDTFTVNNWYASAANQVESVRLSDGKTLAASKVQALVSAMSGFTPPTSGQTTLPANYQTSLNGVIASSWA